MAILNETGLYNLKGTKVKIILNDGTVKKGTIKLIGKKYGKYTAIYFTNGVRTGFCKIKTVNGKKLKLPDAPATTPTKKKKASKGKDKKSSKKKVSSKKSSKKKTSKNKAGKKLPTKKKSSKKKKSKK